MRLAINEKKLKEYMDFKDWNEKTLAKEMGVDYVTVYRVLRGKRSFGNEFIAKLLKACEGAEFEQLFIFDNPSPKGNENNNMEESQK
jgi:transcriptional regulator with XRE-family HTH domain